MAKRNAKAAVSARAARGSRRTSSEALIHPSDPASATPIVDADERKSAPHHEAVHAKATTGAAWDDAYLSAVTLIRKRRLAQLLDINPWTIDRWRRQGKFPEPIWVSDTTPCWRISDIEEWLVTRKGDRFPSAK